MLPDFLVIGAYKSGSTAIQEVLREHPDVFLPAKGPSFFAFDEAPEIDRPLPPGTVRDWDAYQALFADAPEGAVRGEVSPEYLANPWSCGRIHARVPDAKLVAILRNPVERAYSDYLMYVRDGLEHDDFARALDSRTSGVAPARHCLLPRDRLLRPPAPPLLRRLPARGGSRCTSSRTSPPTRMPVLESLFGFLGVDPARGSMPERAVNVSGVPKNALVGAAVRGGRKVAPLLPEGVRRRAKAALVRGLNRPALDPADRARLAEAYRDDVAELERLLQRPLGHWLD